MGAEVGLGEGYAEGGVRGEVQVRVSFAPVFYYGYVHWGCRAGSVDGGGGGHFGGGGWLGGCDV